MRAEKATSRARAVLQQAVCDMEKPDPTPIKPDGISSSRNDGLIRQLIKRNLDPLDELIKLGIRTSDESLRFKIMTELLSYCIPKIKAAEATDVKKEETLNINVIFPKEEDNEEQSTDNNQSGTGGYSTSDAETYPSTYV
jgi:hypothetical protein